MKKFIQKKVAMYLLAIAMCIPGYNANAQSWQNVGPENFPASTAFSISLATNNDTVYMAYADSTNGYKATVVKYVDSNWVTVGSAGFTPGAAYNISLVMDKNGTPYMAYQDYANGQKATVVTYNGSSWATVGNADFSDSRAYYLTLALDTSGAPYVAYEDNNYNNKATVKRYADGDWQTVGTEGFSASPIYSISIAIDHNDSVYVAYEDEASSHVGQVLKFNSTSWVSMPSFTTNGANFPILAVDSSNTLYVAYTDTGANYKATVAKYTGGSWETVGNADFSTNMAEYISFAFDHNNTPYVAYTDFDFYSADTLLKPTVMKYNGTVWAAVGDSLPIGNGFSSYGLLYGSFAIAKSGKLYIAIQNTTDTDKVVVMSYMDSTATVDTTGTDSTTLVRNQTMIQGLIVAPFPDPATSMVTITYAAPNAANTSLAITNIAGQTVLAKDLGKQQSGTMALPVNQLPDGMYILQFTSGTDVARRKIVVSH